MTSIAVIGTSGHLGKTILQTLTSGKFDKIKYPIYGLTTKDKSTESTDKIQYLTINNENLKLIKNIDALISTLGANREILNDITSIINKIHPKIYFPSEFGYESHKLKYPFDLPFLTLKNEHVKQVINNCPQTQIVRVYSGLYRQAPLYLAGFTNQAGVDQNNKVATYVGDENKKFAFSSLTDVSNTLAVLCTKKPKELKGSYSIQSGERSTREIQTECEEREGIKYKEVHKTFEEFSKEIETLNKELKEKYENATTPVKTDGMQLLYFFYAIYIYGKGRGLVFEKLDNEVVNPNESLWKWSTW